MWNVEKYLAKPKTEIFVKYIGTVYGDETCTPCPVAAYGFGHMEATDSVVKGVDF